MKSVHIVAAADARCHQSHDCDAYSSAIQGLRILEGVRAAAGDWPSEMEPWVSVTMPGRMPKFLKCV
eukprot:5949427-Amphidinium_carterae.1